MVYFECLVICVHHLSPHFLQESIKNELTSDYMSTVFSASSGRYEAVTWSFSGSLY
jgi:hypothetical protein